MLIFGLCLSCFLRDYQVTLFCREFQYWRIYAFFVLIFGVEKCACAIFHAFCMSEGTPLLQQNSHSSFREDYSNRHFLQEGGGGLNPSQDFLIDLV